MNNLTLEDYMRLFCGEDMWHTAKSDHITQIMMCDGPHGLRKEREDAKSNNDSIPATCFPTASALACSFDEELVKRVGSAIGREAFNENVSILLGPGVNMKRNPLCGRNFEYYSEDPYLSGMLGASFINGVEEEGVGTSLKHFACNNQETYRFLSSSNMDIRTLREIYLKPFEYVMKNATPATVMASYNKINGVYSTENKWLLEDILRKEWGFEGAVISDWGACTNPVKSMKSGLNLDMPGSGNLHYSRIKKALKKGDITEEELKESVLPVINLIEKYKNNSKDKKNISKNHLLSVEAEEKSAVLLKNEGILPLREKKVTIIGSLAEHVRFQGGGSSHINATSPSAVKALEDIGFNVSYAAGYPDDMDVTEEVMERKAVMLATENVPVLFFGGLPEFLEGEGYDRKTFTLPENQLHLLSEIRKVNENIIFISFGGAPYELSFESDVKAVLQMYLGGEGVMEAMADLVSGRVSPSGRLAETWPISLSDTPSFHNFGNKDLDIYYKESIYIGYRYYDSFDVPVRYPFGHGLSYTSFSYRALTVTEKDGRRMVSFLLKNTGAIPAETSSLIFLENPSCNYLREHQKLIGFKKTFLAPEEEKEVTIPLPEDAFSVYDEEKGWILPSGNYKIKVCGAVNEVFLEASLTLTGEEYNPDERSLYPIYYNKEGKLRNIPDEEYQKLYQKELKHSEFKKGNYDVTTPLGILAKHSLLAKMILKIGISECHKMTPGKPDDDPEVMMNLEALREGTFDSVAAHSGGIVGPRLEDAIILSANGHKMKAIWKLIRG